MFKTSLTDSVVINFKLSLGFRSETWFMKKRETQRGEDKKRSTTCLYKISKLLAWSNFTI
jgi:hypothetical protein